MNLKEKYEDACAELEYDIWRLKKILNEIKDEYPDEYFINEQDVMNFTEHCYKVEHYLTNCDFSFYEKGNKYE